MFGAIKMGLGAIFGSPKSAASLASTATSMFDNAFYTDQERAKAKEKIMPMLIDYMSATKGQDVARRGLAMMAAGMWIFVGMTFMVLLIVGLIADSAATTAASEQIREFMSDVIDTPFMLIMAFYFGPHLIAKMFSGEKKE